MAVKQIILTQEGLEALEKELEYLKSVRRKEVAEKIKVALSFGDLSENSEYDEATEPSATRSTKLWAPMRPTPVRAVFPTNLLSARHCWDTRSATWWKWKCPQA